MLEIDWRSPSGYSQTYTTPIAGVAWEYLRRDEHYHRAFTKIDHRKTLDSGLLKAFSRRWGLRFPA